jgi:16S rRNA (guanine966-N2)-methyltransferase
MRVIAGLQKGRRLFGPKSDDIRPALDKIKGAIFNILGDISGTKVLDLFAGTGSVAIEALSRGASRAVFVDNGTEALLLIRKNLEICRFEDEGLVVKADLPYRLHKLVRKEGPFDLIFVDPPYDKALVNPSLRLIVKEKILAPAGMVIVEHSPRESIGEDSGLILADQRKYGQTVISFLKG